MATEPTTGAADRLARLAESVGPGELVTDPEIVASYATDIVGRLEGQALAVLRPRDAAGVAAAVRACGELGLPLVPQGGATGLVGGAVPRPGEVVLSLRGLDRVGEVELGSNQVEVGAGATLAAVQGVAAAAGLRLPIDLAARDSATVGGMIATDAGGALALRHGTMRRRVVGLEVVLADGETVTRMAGLAKDNAGYDLPALMVGSEGTLGVITAARLQLEPVPGFRVAALFGLAGLEAGLELLGALRSVPGLEAADHLDLASMRLVREHTGLRDPLGAEHPLYLVAECAASVDPTAGLAAAVGGLDPEPEVVAAADTEGRRGLWAYRELFNEAIRARGLPRKLDLGVPPAALPRFDRELRSRLARLHPGARPYLCGHLGDGNLHVNVLAPGEEGDAVDELVLSCAAELGGTVSAEHGIGRTKRRYLPLCRSEADIAAMRALKRALDPAGTLSPGRVLPDRA